MKGTYQRFNGTVSERLLCYNSTTVLVYRWLLYIEQAPSARLNFAYVGCSTSHGTNVIAGVNLGLESTALPVWHSCSKMGMLSTTVYVLTMDMFGPIADNAGGMVQMRQQPKSVREISDILDALHFCSRTFRTVGRTSQEIVNEVRRQFIKWSDIMEYKERPDYGRCVSIVASASLREMIKPGALAIILPILEIVNEVRRQFIEWPDIMEYKERPDYGRCVAIVTSAYLREMIKPGALAVILPILIFCSDFGMLTGYLLLGVKVVAVLIETGAPRGKGIYTHKAAVTVDTLAIVDMKLDIKPGYGETLVLGVASGAALNGIGCVRPHVLKGLGQIWSAVRTATDPSSASTGSGS
ncbi:hypothetical protein ACOSQ3_021710 [Xanthoceras sorbifolium]